MHDSAESELSGKEHVEEEEESEEDTGWGSGRIYRKLATFEQEEDELKVNDGLASEEAVVEATAGWSVSGGDSRYL